MGQSYHIQYGVNIDVTQQRANPRSEASMNLCLCGYVPVWTMNLASSRPLSMSWRINLTQQGRWDLGRTTNHQPVTLKAGVLFDTTTGEGGERRQTQWAQTQSGQRNWAAVVRCKTSKKVKVLKLSSGKVWMLKHPHHSRVQRPWLYQPKMSVIDILGMRLNGQLSGAFIRKMSLQRVNVGCVCVNVFWPKEKISHRRMPYDQTSLWTV